MDSYSYSLAVVGLGVRVVFGFGVTLGAFWLLGVAEGVEMIVTDGTGVL